MSEPEALFLSVSEHHYWGKRHPGHSVRDDEWTAEEFARGRRATVSMGAGGRDVRAEGLGCRKGPVFLLFFLAAKSLKFVAKQPGLNVLSVA